MEHPEMEEITFPVNVQSSGFGAVTESLEDEIAEAEENADGSFWSLIGTLKKFLDYLKLMCKVLDILHTLLKLIGSFGADLSDIVRAVPGGAAEAPQICETIGGGSEQVRKRSTSFFEKFCNIVTCKWSAVHIFSQDAGNQFQESWTNQVQNYNVGLIPEAGAAIKSYGTPPSPDRSLISSIISLCLPGIIYNLEKLRQIECRYVGCLKNEVAAGVTTIRGCRELKSYQNCKYWMGELFQMLPFAPFIDSTLGQVKSMITDPVGIVMAVVGALCAPIWCKIAGRSFAICRDLVWLQYMIKLGNDVASLADDFKSIKVDLCDEVLGGGEE